MAIFRSICLPLAMPGVAVSAILSFIFSWNELLFAYILAPKDEYGAGDGGDIHARLRRALREDHGDLDLIVMPVLIFALLASMHLARG